MDRNTLRRVAGGILVGALFAVSPALAQTPTASAKLAMPSSPRPSGDPSDGAPLSGFLLSAPIRLSLVGSVLPKASMFPDCDTLEDDVGNSVGGIPVQHYWDLHLMPKLVLSVFSQLGCPIDAGIGAALTYTVALRESAWLVFGAGLYAAPGQFPLFGGVESSVLKGLQGSLPPADGRERRYRLEGQRWTPL